MGNSQRNPKLYLDTVKKILRNQQNLPNLPPLVGKLQGPSVNRTKNSKWGLK